MTSYFWQHQFFKETIETHFSYFRRALYINDFGGLKHQNLALAIDNERFRLAMLTKTTRQMPLIEVFNISLEIS